MRCTICNAMWLSEELTNCPYCQARVEGNINNNNDFTHYESCLELKFSECENIQDQKYPHTQEERDPNIHGSIENYLNHLQNIMVDVIKKYSYEIYDNYYDINAITNELFPKNDYYYSNVKVIINDGSIFDLILDCKDLRDDDFIRSYYKSINVICRETELGKKDVQAVINMFFYPIGIDCSNINLEHECHYLPQNIANDVLNSVLNTTSDDTDFASSVLNFVNNPN